LRNIRIVLHQPRGAINVGAAARAVANMGLGELVIVGRQALRPAWVRAMAAHAGQVVDTMRRCDTLAEAVADCALVVGTTCRAGGYRRDVEPPRALAPAIVARARCQPVALIFGPEDHGLSNADLKLCHRLVTIPTAPEYPSLNLAQAVMICAYEVRLAAGRRAPKEAPHPLAPNAAREEAFDRLQSALLAIGFLHPDNPDHIMLALRKLFGRTGLDAREVRILLGLARQIEWYAREGWRTRQRRARGAGAG
jgi:tRNA/rRNA methyltransferase